MNKIFAFDMGKASIGFCAREDNEIKSLGSVIIDVNHADSADNRARYRVHKTIEAHRAREKWFDELWLENGLPEFSKKDDFFKKEFASACDETIYNSTLLRCALIQGRKLETWQIYKALSSAIQRRGYDSSIAWADSEDDEENRKAAEKYTQKDGIELIISDEYKYPCFYDALLLGLWEENNPYEFKRSIGLNPEKVRTAGRTAPRELVIKELTKLWDEAKKQLPQLKKVSAEEFLYGNYREAYGSYKNPEWMHLRGTKADWQGVLGQKIPRFDNRIISKCRLMPKRNVCSADTIENISLVLLMQLKNFRYTNAFSFETGLRLSPVEIKQIYENKLSGWIESLNKYRKGELKKPSFTITKKDIEDVIGKKTIKDNMEKFSADISGRSSFCRRACRIMIDIITSGIEPLELDIEKYIDKEGSKNPVTKEEIKTMLEKTGAWNELHISDNRYEQKELAETADKESDLLIGSITNPVVRNRLQIFKNLLADLIKENGAPDKVIFEFARDSAENSMFGKIKTESYINTVKNNEKENELIKKALEDSQSYSETNFLKYKLAKIQDFRCIYSGEKIGISDFDACQIDHIFPRTAGGNDALYNKVICFNKENQDKAGRTPYEWLYNNKERWSEFTNRVQSLKKSLGKKKAELLTLPPDKCAEKIKSYNGLAETAQIARIASAITHYMCGWGMQTKGDNRHVFVENGSITAKIRKSYKLNSILGDDEKKNRSNPKHHAVDAVCISYAMDYKFNEQTHKYSAEGLKRDYVQQKIDEFMPFPYTHKKPLKKAVQPLETIYGKRKIGDEYFITSRTDITDLKQDIKAVRNIIDTVIKEDLTAKLESNMPSADWKNMLADYIHPKKKTKVKKVLITVSEGSLDIDENGRERIGEYSDFGTKGTNGQFKHSKAHRGQILYFDNKGAVKVQPVYSNKSLKEVREELQDKNCRLYKGGEMFYSGCLVQIPNDFKAAEKTYSKGIYKLRTVRLDGVIKLENNIGQEINTSAKNLAEAGFYKKKD